MVDYNVTENVAIAAITLYNPLTEGYKCRSKLAKNFIREARDMGYSLFVVDGGSPPEFLRFLYDNGVNYTMEVQDVKYKSGPNRRMAIQNASKSGKKVITLTELDKRDFLKKINKTAEPILEGKAAAVIPGRNSMKSYTRVQQIFEICGNSLWEEIMGDYLDIFFGVRVFDRDVAHYFTQYDGRYGDEWESSFIPVMDMIRDGKKVVGLEIDYRNSPAQTKDESDNFSIFAEKRLRQFNNIVRAILKHSEEFKGRR
jgi:hypothetical protein